MKHLDHMYISKQIKPIIESVEDSQYPATLKISHDGKATKTLNVTSTQLKAIRKIMLSDDDTINEMTI